MTIRHHRARRTAACRLALASAVLALAALPLRAEIVAPGSVDPGAGTRLTLGQTLDEPAILEVWTIPRTAEGGSVLIDRRVVSPPTDRVEITAPARAGSYRLRLTRGDTVLDTGTLEVAARPVSLSTPRVVPPGGTMSVTWEARGTGDDLLAVETGQGVRLSQTPTGPADNGRGRTDVPVPAEGGTYGLVYVDGDSGTVLARQSFTVDRVRAWVRAPAQTAAGEPFRVTVFGPAGADAVLRIAEPGGAVIEEIPVEGVAGPDGGRTLSLTAPGTDGRHRLLYVNRATGEVYSDLPLILD